MSNFYFFYKTRHPFSQWHPCEFEVDGVWYNCAEQYMMHQKALLFNDQQTAKKILSAKDPNTQKKLGREVKGFVASLWDISAKAIVYDGNYNKFTQNQKLLDVLLSTGDAELVEASPYDTIWGIGLGEDNPDRFDKSKWKGTNWLGETLTLLRNNLIKEQTE